MDTVSRGRHTLALVVVGAFATSGHAAEWPGGIVVGRGEAVQWESGDVLRVQGDKAFGIRVAPRATFDAEAMSLIHEGAGGPNGYAHGILALDGAEVSLVSSRIDIRGRATIGLQVQRDGVATLQDTAIRLSPAAGTHATALALAGGTATLRDSSIEAARGHAISTHFAGNAGSRVILENTTIRGRIGSGETQLGIVAVGSGVDGDIMRDGSAPLDVRMLRGTWRGKAARLSAVSLEDSTWTVTADSDITVLRLERGGRIAFDGVSTGFVTVRAARWHAAAGTRGIELGSRLDAGGALRRQSTDRLLVTGEATGVTPVHVANAGGGGASTAGRDGVNGPEDGISLIQVGGNASVESFRLVGDYVAVGPWQYRLRAYGPGQSDPKQRLLDGTGGDYWDFRLQSAGVEDERRQGHGRGAGDVAVRGALAPQVPAYLVLAHALFGYGATALDALRPVELDPPREPALRVRGFGSSVAYRSTRPFGGYGIDYKRHDRGVQVAGDLLVHAVGDTTLRAGLAASLGGTRILPHAADGQSDARVDARGLAWHAELETESDWRVASSYAVTHYRVDVRTPQRGEVLGRLRANANEAALSAAYRWRSATRLLVEPEASVTWQRLRFSRAMDGDGIDVRARTPERVALRGGARASLSFLPKGRWLYAWSPYADLRYTVTRGSGESVWLSGERLPTGRAARRVELSAGTRFHLWSRVTAYIDMTSRLRVGPYGESGLSARAGLALQL